MIQYLKNTDIPANKSVKKLLFKPKDKLFIEY